MKIPIFVSCPTKLDAAQEATRALILEKAEEYELDPHSVGRPGDYAVDTPLLEAAILARHCAGGLVLGFTQTFMERGVKRRGSPDEQILLGVPLPTPWNHLEAGLLFSQRVPLLVFREQGVVGGIFDAGASDLFIHSMPDPGRGDDVRRISELMLKWHAHVYQEYHRLD